MTPSLDWPLSTVKVLNKLHEWLVKNRLRTRGEELARNVPTGSVLRGSRTKLRWYEWTAARQLQSEGVGTIRDGYYETWINVTSSAILQALPMR